MAAKINIEGRETRGAGPAGGISTRTAVMLAVVVGLLGILLWVLVVVRFR